MHELLGGLAQLVDGLVLGQGGERLEESVLVRVVCVVLDLGQAQQLRPGEPCVGGAAGRGLSKVDLGGSLRGERDRVVERRVPSRVAHPEAWRGRVDGCRVEHAGLERRERAAARLRHRWVRAGRPVVSPLCKVLVVAQLFAHQTLVRVASWVQTSRVVLTWIGQTLLHELVTVAVTIHLGPVAVLCGAAKVAHWCCRVRCSLGHNWWPLVRPVRVLLHVLCQVGLLSVTLATVGTDVRLQVLRLLVLGDVLEQGDLVVEALVAGVALVRLVSLVAPRVGLQVGQLGERLGATWQETLRKQL